MMMTIMAPLAYITAKKTSIFPTYRLLARALLKRVHNVGAEIRVLRNAHHVLEPEEVCSYSNACEDQEQPRHATHNTCVVMTNADAQPAPSTATFAQDGHVS